MCTEGEGSRKPGMGVRRILSTPPISWLVVKPGTVVPGMGLISSHHSIFLEAGVGGMPRFGFIIGISWLIMFDIDCVPERVYKRTLGRHQEGEWRHVCW